MPSISGKFEVRIVDGPFLHSKKNGMGFVDTEEKFAHLDEGIMKGIEEMEKVDNEKTRPLLKTVSKTSNSSAEFN
jgi:hypothetical protein